MKGLGRGGQKCIHVDTRRNLLEERRNISANLRKQDLSFLLPLITLCFSCFWIVWWVRQVCHLSEVWNTLTSCFVDKAGMVVTIFWVSGITEKILRSSRPALRTTPAKFSFFNTVSQVADGVKYWSVMTTIVRKFLKCERFLLSQSMGFPGLRESMW